MNNQNNDRNLLLHDDSLATTADCTLTDKQIDVHLDTILKASGSAMRNYSMQKTIDSMRGALRSVLKSCTSSHLTVPKPNHGCHIDANYLEEFAKNHPDEFFLKGSGVLKLLGGIRKLEAKNRELLVLQSTVAAQSADY